MNKKYCFSLIFSRLLYTFNEVALETWLTLDNCYLIGWNQNIPPRGSE